MTSAPNKTPKETPVVSSNQGRAVTPSVDPPSADGSFPYPCLVTILPDGTGCVTITIPPEIMRRLKSRAQNVPLGEYIWHNILKRAIETHVY